MNFIKMMSHKLGDQMKDAMRKGIRHIYEHAVDEERLENELNSTDDPVVKILHDMVNQVIEHTQRRPHARNWRQIGRFGLWVVLDDPAHRHQVLWLLDQLVNERVEEMREALEEVGVPEPERFYVNRFEEGEAETRELREESDASRVTGLESPFFMGEKGKDLMLETDEENLPF